MNKNTAEIILQALEAKKSTSKPAVIANQPKDSFVKVVKNTRQPTRPSIVKLRDEAISNENAIEKMMDFVGESGNIYLTFGGVGDIVLLLAECYKDKNAKIVFYANSSSKEFGNKFLEYFGMKYISLNNIFGTSDAHRAVNLLQSTGRLQTSAHLPDGLDYGDWIRNTNKYAKRIVTDTDWVERFGIDDDLSKQKFMLFAPTGSFKGMHKQKFLMPHEADAVVKLYLNKGFLVYIVGTDEDKLYYQSIRNPKVFWLHTDKIVDNMNNITSITFDKFIKIINSASEYCSTDTWLKTYSCLLGKKTIVFDNRYNSKYSFGADSGDLIFLNKFIWPSLRLVKIEEFIKYDIYV